MTGASRLRKADDGFTLLEVLVSLVISAIVLAGVYASFSAVMDTRRRVETGAKIDMTARLVLTRLAREIESAFLVKRTEDAPPESRYTIFTGSQSEISGQPGDRLSFSTFSHAKRGIDANESDQSVIEYTTEENEPGASTAGGAGTGPGREEGEPSVALLRREWRRIPSPREATRTEPRAIALVDDIRGFRVRFRDGAGEWTDRWDSTEVRTLDVLPTAVELTLTLRDGSGRDRDFVTVASPRIAPIERESLGGGEQGAPATTLTGDAAPTGPTTPAPGKKTTPTSGGAR